MSFIDVLLSGVSPLALTNALGLNYIKAFGATEQQKNLPSEYTQLEYIESTGTQYINTGIVPTNTTEVFVRFYVPTVNVLDKYIFQSRTTGSSNVRYGARIQDGKLNVLFGDFSAAIYSTPISIGWHTLKITPQSFILDDTTEVPITQSFTDTMGTFKLFCYGNAAGGFWSGRISEFVADGKRLLPAVKSGTVGMYDLASGQFLTNAGTGTFTAGADATPTPDNPMDIICNNGVIKYGQYGKNLFDKNNTQMAKEWRVENDGKVYRDIGSQTIVIPVQPNTTYTVQADLTGYSQSSPPVGRIVFFTTYPVPDTTVGTVHTQVGSRLPYTFTTGNNTAYVTIWLNRTGNIAQQVWDSTQLELGSTATEYEPYHFGIHTDGTQETVTVTGTGTGKNLFNKDDTVVGYLTDQGVLVKNNTGKTSGLIKVQPGSVYTLKLYRSSQQILTRVCSYDSDGNFVSLLVRDPTTAIGYNIDTFTADAEYVRISFHTDSTEVQLEVGSTPTDYEPYGILGTANAEMLLKVGDYKDEQELLTGNITRNVGIKVLDGTEEWWHGGIIYYNTMRDILPTANDIICTHASYGTDPTTTNKIGYRSAKNGIWISRSDLNSVDEFKQWLADQYNAGTPVIVVYPTSSPVTEQVAPQSLTASGNCTVTATGSLDNLELELSYKQSTNSNKITTPPTQNEVIEKINELVDDKQDTLTAGANIQIVNNTISATDTTYTAGTGIDISDSIISVDTSVAMKSDLPTKVSELTNDSGYITGITGSDVTTALGYTPYNATNPSGYITLSALTPYATQNWVENKGYLTEIPAEYVTDSELTAKGYQTAADVETAITTKGYTTMSAVEAKGYITNSALAGYATESYVTTAVGTETTARQNADNNLQSQIDAITASSDVTDIVGTYAELQNYDTSALAPNSIIKVLQDESRNNETTYYRWVITGGVGSWSLIGEEGPYYTIAAADAKFATQTALSTGLSGKQDTISDLATIRSGAALGATAVQSSDLATVATSGSYNDLSNKPTIPAAQVNSDWNATSGVARILNKPTIPTVPTNISAFTNDAGYITNSALTGYATENYVDTGLATKQATLVSGTNIKTINNTSILGSGNIDIQGGGSSYTAGTGIDITNNVISAKIATSVSSTSTNGQSVGAKLFYDTVGDIETLINAL